jgi:hypothetical protein
MGGRSWEENRLLPGSETRSGGVRLDQPASPLWRNLLRELVLVVRGSAGLQEMRNDPINTGARYRSSSFAWHRDADDHTVREIPLSNSDILIANGGDASAPTGTAGFKDHDVGAESRPGKTTAPSSVIE